MDGVTVFLGLHGHLRADAARIYWEAFGGKLGRVLGPERQALAFFERVMRQDHCFTAVAADGALVGLAGFKTAIGSFAGGGWSDLRAVYGNWGGRWRAAALWLLNHEADSDRFLIDGLCVARSHRSQGIGTLLLTALFAEATARGYSAIRLDVVDENWRARALYARHGFITTRTENLGLLRHLFGFKALTTMVQPLPQSPQPVKLRPNPGG